MKALILAGGRGKRLGELSQEKNKCMVEIMNKPLIGYSLDCAVQNNVSEIVIVVGYKKEDIMSAFGNKYKEKPIKYVIQEEQKGLVHAIECAKEAIGKEDFMLLLGDELMVGSRHSEMIKKYYDKGLFAVCGVLRVDDESLIEKTYAIQEKEGRITDLIEKPDIEKIKDKGLMARNVMGTGNCIFSHEIFDYIPKTPINQKRGEKELPDLIKCAINDGRIVEAVFICDKYFNINIKEEIKEAGSCFFHLS
jgi:NDP-sugar pyrophosphorylase family protein